MGVQKLPFEGRENVLEHSNTLCSAEKRRRREKIGILGVFQHFPLISVYPRVEPPLGVGGCPAELVILSIVSQNLVILSPMSLITWKYWSIQF